MVSWNPRSTASTRTIPDTAAIRTTRATRGTSSVWLSGLGERVIGLGHAHRRGALRPPSYPAARPSVAGSNGSGARAYSQTERGTTDARTVVRFQVKPGILPS